jgi:hypothetical protein
MNKSHVVQFLVGFAILTAAVYTGNYLYSRWNKAKIAPPDSTAATPATK